MQYYEPLIRDLRESGFSEIRFCREHFFLAGIVFYRNQVLQESGFAEIRFCRTRVLQKSGFAGLGFCKESGFAEIGF